MHGLLLAGAPLAAGVVSRARGLQQLSQAGSGAQAQELWHLGLVGPRHVESSHMRHGIYVPCIDRWLLNQWAARAVWVTVCLMPPLCFSEPCWLCSPGASWLCLISSHHFFQLSAVCPLNHWNASPLRIIILCLISEAFKIKCKLLMSCLCSLFFKDSLCSKRWAHHPQHCGKALCNPAPPTPVVSSTAPPSLTVTYVVA